MRRCFRLELRGAEELRELTRRQPGHSTVTLRFRPEVNAQALELTLQNDTTAAYDGKAFSKSAEHKLSLE